MPLLQDFRVVRPPFTLSQKALHEWIYAAHQRNNPGPSFEENFLKITKGISAIEERGTVIEDCLSYDFDSMKMFPTNLLPQGINVDERLRHYDQFAGKFFEEIYEERALPDHLIHVTCTGYLAPSPAQKLIAAKKAYRTQVTHAYHMGCYGSLPALSIGSGFLAAHPTRSIDIVHTELCTLHFDPSRFDLEQLVIHSLFADGCIGYRMGQNPPGLKLLALHEELIPDSLESMLWNPSTHGMKMRLHKDVPVKIGRHIEKVIDHLLAKVNLSKNEINGGSYFAIHPGGPKIIDMIAKLLCLEERQITHSREILRSMGNMSSATLPHIWDRILKDDSIPHGAYIVSMAFGPGLTAATALLQKVLA